MKYSNMKTRACARVLKRVSGSSRRVGDCSSFFRRSCICAFIQLHHDLFICWQIFHLLVCGKQQHRGAEVSRQGVLGRMSVQQRRLLWCLAMQTWTRTHHPLNEITHHEEQQQNQKTRKFADDPVQVIQESVWRKFAALDRCDVLL